MDESENRRVSTLKETGEDEHNQTRQHRVQVITNGDVHPSERSPYLYSSLFILSLTASGLLPDAYPFVNVRASASTWPRKLIHRCWCVSEFSLSIPNIPECSERHVRLYFLLPSFRSKTPFVILVGQHTPRCTILPTNKSLRLRMSVPSSRTPSIRGPFTP